MADNSPMLRLLQDRVSVPARMLTEPGPTIEETREAIRAAVSVPDHGNLRPWHFVVVRGDWRAQLGDLFGAALKRRNPDATKAEISNERQKAYRAPMVVIVFVKTVLDNPKVPVTEQITSGGAAAQNILLAFEAMGYGSIILTGENSQDEGLKAAFGITDKDVIIGMIYVGSPPERKPSKRRPNGEDFEGHFQIWTGE